jgi:hypothetical protein
MNILLWILQGVLALLCLAGGGYKLAKPDDLVKQEKGTSATMWRVLGLIEVVGGILLIVPGLIGWRPELAAIAAGVIGIENLGLSVRYAMRSVKLVAANPLVWSASMALIALFVAYGRYVPSPLA